MTLLGRIFLKRFPSILIMFVVASIYLPISQNGIGELLGISSSGSVIVDFQHLSLTSGRAEGSPLLFGGSNQPNRSHFPDVYRQMSEVGLTFERGTAWLDEILPRNITLSDYQKNVNDIQNPDRWNWDTEATQNTAWIKAAKQHGFTVMLNILKVPGWLSYNGDYYGVPK